jgi:hypothetical protein
MSARLRFSSRHRRRSCRCAACSTRRTTSRCLFWIFPRCCCFMGFGAVHGCLQGMDSNHSNCCSHGGAHPAAHFASLPRHALACRSRLLWMRANKFRASIPKCAALHAALQPNTSSRFSHPLSAPTTRPSQVRVQCFGSQACSHMISNTVCYGSKVIHTSALVVGAICVGARKWHLNLIDT